MFLLGLILIFLHFSKLFWSILTLVVFSTVWRSRCILSILSTPISCLVFHIRFPIIFSSYFDHNSIIFPPFAQPVLYNQIVTYLDLLNTTISTIIAWRAVQIEHPCFFLELIFFLLPIVIIFHQIETNKTIFIKSRNAEKDPLQNFREKVPRFLKMSVKIVLLFLCRPIHGEATHPIFDFCTVYFFFLPTGNFFSSQ